MSEPTSKLLNIEQLDWIEALKSTFEKILLTVGKI